MTEILDVIVIVLLIVAIVYGFVLNKRMVIIQSSRKELANLFKSFDDTILKAQIAIDKLKEVNTEVSTNLQSQIDKATVAADDLSFLSDKAAKIANGLMKNTIADKPNKNEIKKENLANDYGPEHIKRLKQESKQNSIKVADTVSSGKTKEQKTRALEKLLERISDAKSMGIDKTAKNDNRRNVRKPAVDKPAVVKSDAKSKEMVADMLKDLGYGE